MQTATIQKRIPGTLIKIYLKSSWIMFILIAWMEIRKAGSGMAMRKKQLLYMQLREDILKDYQNKPYYSPMPGERELCEIYHVSRPTVRRALEILEEEGCITRFAGKGAFFIGNKKQQGNNYKASSQIAFYNQVRLRGDYTSSKVLTQKAEIVNPEIAELLGIREGGMVFHLERLRYINGKLWTLADSYIDYELCPELLNYDYAERSLHNTLAGHGYVPFRAQRCITARKANEYDAFHLGLKEGAPICYTKTRVYDREGKLLECAISRGDIYKIRYDITTYNQTNGEDERAFYKQNADGKEKTEENPGQGTDKSIDNDNLLW